jgi:DNA-binding NarL/FixJ family response regulator
MNSTRGRDRANCHQASSASATASVSVAERGRAVVQILGSDPLLTSGLRQSLEDHPGTEVTWAPHEEAAITVLVAARTTLREMFEVPERPLVLVTQDVDERAVPALLDRGLVAVLNFAEASASHRLGDTVTAAATGKAALPHAFQAQLLRHLRDLHREVLAPAGLTSCGLSTRECDILRLVADGLDTATIARRLAFSERTVKYALEHLMARRNLTSRAHAVAYAVRCGAI